MKTGWLTLVALLLLSACHKKTTLVPDSKEETKQELGVFKKTFQAQDTQNLDIPVIMEFRKTACFGFCPTYDFRLYSNGIYQYQGHQFVKTEGQRFGVFDEESWKIITAKALHINFFNLEKEYPTQEQHAIPDLPKTITRLSIHTNDHTVTNSHSAPESLIELEKIIEQILNRTIGILPDNK